MLALSESLNEAIGDSMTDKALEHFGLGEIWSVLRIEIGDDEDSMAQKAAEKGGKKKDDIIEETEDVIKEMEMVRRNTARGE
jgi:hypothetical protein